MKLFDWIHMLCLFPAADDPVDHVRTLHLGTIQQRHDCVLLVWNEIQGNLLHHTLLDIIWLTVLLKDSSSIFQPVSYLIGVLLDLMGSVQY